MSSLGAPFSATLYTGDVVRAVDVLAAWSDPSAVAAVDVDDACSAVFHIDAVLIVIRSKHVRRAADDYLVGAVRAVAAYCQLPLFFWLF